MPGATITIDTSGLSLAWSRDAEALLGYRETEALGQSIELIMPEHLRARHHAGFSRFVQTGVSTLPEMTSSPMIHKSRATIRPLISVKAVYDAERKIVAVEAFIRSREAD